MRGNAQSIGRGRGSRGPNNGNASRNYRRSNLRFVGCDIESEPIECRACDCDHFLPDPVNEDMCLCGHPKKATETSSLVTGHIDRPVLFGVGTKQIKHYYGLKWYEMLEHAYSQFADDIVFVGYVFKFDFNLMFSSASDFPWNKASQLWTKQGQDKRRFETKHGNFSHYVKVESPVAAMYVDIPSVQKAIDNGTLLPDENLVWELHLHADRRLTLRPKLCGEAVGCPGDTHKSGCTIKSAPGRTAQNMYINDCGGYFQTSFMSVINPEKWTEAPLPPVMNRIIERGKNDRSSATLSRKMEIYNMAENIALRIVMTKYADGLRSEGIRFGRDDSYGPGQQCKQWMKIHKIPKHDEIQEKVNPRLIEWTKDGFTAGWFEIPVHGIIPGDVEEWDINSAYPFVLSQLPCLLHGKYSGQTFDEPYSGDEPWVDPVSFDDLPPLPPGAIRYIRAAVYGNDPYIGVASHRTFDGRILRPTASRGYFWQKELEASIRAGVIDDVDCYEWITYEPCDCLPPFNEIPGLYQKRLEAGKNTPYGKGMKLLYNSMFGVQAQSIGNPPYSNPVFASLIVSGCRTMILNAIADHPDKTKAVAMVATDGVYFLTPHPRLNAIRDEYISEWNAVHPGKPIDKDERLGSFDKQVKHNLTLFKPGVYWDDKDRKRIRDGKTPEMKARGVNVRDFSQLIESFDEEFRSWNGIMPVEEKDWPRRKIKIRFSMVSAKQALSRGNVGMELKLAKPDDEEYKARLREWLELDEDSRFDLPEPSEIVKAKDRWQLSGLVSDVEIVHSAWPGNKRMVVNYNGSRHEACGSRDITGFDGRVYRSRPHVLSLTERGLPPISKYYSGDFGYRAMVETGVINVEGYGISPDGNVGAIEHQVIRPE